MRPKYSAYGVPGIGSITVHRDGRVVLADDTELSRDELAELVSVAMRANTIARRAGRKLTRPATTTTELDQLADHEEVSA